MAGPTSDLFFLLSSRKNEHNLYSHLQLSGSNIDSDVSSNMAIIGKINIWSMGRAAAVVESSHCVKGGAHLQGRSPLGGRLYGSIISPRLT